jgi:uncharacterized NAD-dependent epimerase/dehydratase family protein
MAPLAAPGAELLDVRDPGEFEIVAIGLARQLSVKRVLTIGVDCVVGKMMTALELTFAARRAGLSAEFVPTGQTGIMIAGWGLCVDRVISDFAAGAAECLVQQVSGWARPRPENRLSTWPSRQSCQPPIQYVYGAEALLPAIRAAVGL